MEGEVGESEGAVSATVNSWGSGREQAGSYLNNRTADKRIGRKPHRARDKKKKKKK
jgi:hypothetical protein